MRPRGYRAHAYACTVRQPCWNLAAGGRQKQVQGMARVQWKVSMFAWCGLSQQRALSKGWRMATPSGGWYGASSGPFASWSGCSCRPHLLDGLLRGLWRPPHNCSLPTKHPAEVLASAATATFDSSHESQVDFGQKPQSLISRKELCNPNHMTSLRSQCFCASCCMLIRLPHMVSRDV